MNRRDVWGILRYLDVFLVVAETHKECQRNLQTLIHLLCCLGFAIVWDKVISPHSGGYLLGDRD